MEAGHQIYKCTILIRILSGKVIYFEIIFFGGKERSWIFKSFSDATATTDATADTTAIVSAANKILIIKLFPETPTETLEDHSHC